MHVVPYYSPIRCFSFHTQWSRRYMFSLRCNCYCFRDTATIQASVVPWILEVSPSADMAGFVFSFIKVISTLFGVPFAHTLQHCTPLVLAMGLIWIWWWGIKILPIVSFVLWQSEIWIVWNRGNVGSASSLWIEYLSCVRNVMMFTAVYVSSLEMLGSIICH